MPITKVQVNGKVGWRFGLTGQVFVGKNGKKRALQQQKNQLEQELQAIQQEKGTQ